MRNYKALKNYLKNKKTNSFQIIDTKSPIYVKKVHIIILLYCIIYQYGWKNTWMEHGFKHKLYHLT